MPVVLSSETDFNTQTFVVIERDVLPNSNLFSRRNGQWWYICDESEMKHGTKRMSEQTTDWIHMCKNTSSEMAPSHSYLSTADSERLCRKDTALECCYQVWWPTLAPLVNRDEFIFKCPSTSSETMATMMPCDITGFN